MTIFEKVEDYAAFTRVLEEADGDLSRFVGWLTLPQTEAQFSASRRPICARVRFHCANGN